MNQETRTTLKIFWRIFLFFFVLFIIQQIVGFSSDINQDFSGIFSSTNKDVIIGSGLNYGEGVSEQEAKNLFLNNVKKENQNECKSMIHRVTEDNACYSNCQIIKTEYIPNLSSYFIDAKCTHNELINAGRYTLLCFLIFPLIITFFIIYFGKKDSSSFAYLSIIVFFAFLLIIFMFFVGLNLGVYDIKVIP